MAITKYDAELARWRAANGWRAFADHAAGDAIAGIPGRIALVVVLAGVDHRRGAALMEDRIGLAFVECDRRIEHLEFERASRRNVQVRHVAGMARSAQHTVMSVGRIEMA